MVALTPRFAILAAFISAASLSVNAIVIPRESGNSSVALPLPGVSDSTSSGPAGDKNSTATEGNSNKARFAWPPVKEMLRLAQLKNRKRYHHMNDILDIDIPGVLEVELGRREQQHFFAPRRVVIPHKHGKGKAYQVPHARSRKHRKHGKGGRVHHRRSHAGVEGTIDIMSPDANVEGGKKLASLELIEQAGQYIFSASEKGATHMYLVNAPSTSRAQSDMPTSAESDIPVILQVVLDDAEDWCTSYNVKDSQAAPLTLEKCRLPQPNEETETTTSQVFSYNGKTGTVRPFWYKPTGPESAQGVLGRNDAAPAQNVTLVFVPTAPQVANAQEALASESVAATTSTMTKTITVTSTPTASVAAAAADVTSSSSTSASTTDAPLASATATPAAFGALDVQVVGPPNSSTESSSEAAPTTTINAQDIASSIAASSTAPVSSSTAAAAAMDPSESATTTDVPTSTATPSAAALDESSETTSTDSTTAAAEATPFSTEPYKWVFRRE
ncbi:hypothetical protein DXG03_001613 [Asterophora parasitica]|uniref:Uncharacterized protein n=1 Tax=Asterophora parasitica TaxID=117018 RepID=A0A9P7G4R1_9AGAR|nr:hypothetical protein DXG03_001613 [Asterophora parasitica]